MARTAYQRTLAMLARLERTEMTENDQPRGARDRVIAAVEEVLREPPPEYLVGDLFTVIATLVADRLEQEPGFLVYAGEIRNLEIADRFGPSSWEITTEQYPEDLAAWHA